jgi:2-polyprenyl-3-methyl-5-hydroxy-6-metoxy-1,4-benzoquinol methylase
MLIEGKLKSRRPIVEDGIIAGNIQDKYGTRNIIYKNLMARFLGTAKRMILSIKDEVRSLLDVGCGEGKLAEFLDSLDVAPVRACDFSGQVIDLAISSHPRSRVEFYKKSIYDLDGHDRSDLVVCCEVLEHLRDPEQGLANLAATAGKYVLVSVPNEPLWRVLNILRLNYLGDLGNTPGHLNHWSGRRFAELLTRRLEIVEMERPLPWLMALCRKRS